MGRALIGSLLFAVPLAVLPGSHSPLACLAGGFLAVYLVEQMGARSIVEKTGGLMTAALLAWVAGPSPSRGTGLAAYLFGWLLASSALAWYLHPRSE
ncbi:MAG: hypothetical protein HY552_00605 [Elusimicrobia bacterium]|nr:hypothetical protein [Elusimicrobiota bacterium]